MSTPYCPIPTKITDKDLAECCAEFHMLVAQPSQADALAALGINATVYSIDPKTIYPSTTEYTHIWIEYPTLSAEFLRLLAPVKRNVKLIIAPQTIEALYYQERIAPDADDQVRTHAIYDLLTQDNLTGLQFLADRVKRARDHSKRTELLTLIDLWRSLDIIGQTITISDTLVRAGVSTKEWYTISSAYQPATTSDRKTRWTAAEIRKAIFPEPEFIVPGLIPLGLTILAGRPKSGKSFLALQLCIAVASGSAFLDRLTQKRKVLYCALEDSPRRIQQRMVGQDAWKHAKESELDITYEFEIPPLSGPGAARIYEGVKKEGFGLVIVDTFTRAAGKADQMDQVEMAACMNALHQIALQENIGIIIIDHHRKNSGFSGDVIDDILGATSKSGVVDTAIGIYNNRGVAGAVLKATGRDIDETINLAITFNEETLRWSCQGTAEEVSLSTGQQSIINIISTFEGGQATTAQLADKLNRDRGQVSNQIKVLVEKGLLLRCLPLGREVPYRLSDFTN